MLFNSSEMKQGICQLRQKNWGDGHNFAELNVMFDIPTQWYTLEELSNEKEELSPTVAKICDTGM